MEKNSRFLVREWPSFLVSCLALSLQFIHTRVLSVVYWQHLVYSILSVAMLGFAASGTFSAQTRWLKDASLRKALSLCLTGFALSSVLSVALITTISGDFFTDPKLAFTLPNMACLALSYLVAAVPYFFFGLLILVLFQRNEGQAGKVYCANLLGSAAGCVLYVALITPLGLLSFLRFLVFVPAATGGLAFSRGASTRFRALTLSSLALAFLVSYFIEISPEPHKQFHTLSKNRTVEFTEWNPISRVDVISDSIERNKYILIDGDALSPLLPLQSRIESEARFHWPGSRPGKAPAFTFNADGFRDLGMMIKLRPGNQAAKRGRRVVTYLSWKDSRQARTTALELVPGRWNQVYLGLDGTHKLANLHIGTRSQRAEVPEGFAFGGVTEVALSDVADGQRRFSGKVAEARIWDRHLDALEIKVELTDSDLGEKLMPHTVRQWQGAPPAEQALVIGNGGGGDSIAAYSAGAKHITAVEINPSSYRAVKGRYAPYLGHLFEKPNVELVLEDGRSFLHRSAKKFDVIAMAGVDSMAALSSGAYILAESYLYTQEAFFDYWDHLSPSGVLQLGRWHYPQAPRETLRAFIMAYKTLRARGVAEPWRHLVVAAYKDAEVIDGNFATLVLSKAPFSIQATEKLGAWLSEMDMELIFDGPGKKPAKENAYHRYVIAEREGQEAEFLRQYPFDVSPVSDDNPFFFQYGRWLHLFLAHPGGPRGWTTLYGDWPLWTLFLLLVECVICVALLLRWPLKRAKKEGPLPASPLLYFSTLGFGFLFVEMFLMQRCVLVLGHPIYSMGVTLPALLLGAGLGSYLSSRLTLSKKTTLGLFFGVCFVLAVLHWGLPAFLVTLLQKPLAVRAAGVMGIIFPVGCLLGMPFPLGMRSLGGRRELMDLAWTANAGMSVIASVLAVVIAMHAGFSMLLNGAIYLYAAALVLFPWPQEEKKFEGGVASGGLIPAAT